MIVMFDLTDRKSFHNVEKWLGNVATFKKDAVELILVGNKIDLAAQRAVRKSEAQEFADQRNIPYIETSAKTEENVNEAVLQLTSRIYENFRKQEEIAGPDAVRQQPRSFKVVSSKMSNTTCCS